MSTSSWVDEFARWTIKHAAHRAPPPLAERLEEEWLADLEARPEPWSRLLLGIGCCWAAAVIVQEDLAPCLMAATTTGNKVMSSYASTNGSLVPQRTTALALIIALHVLLVFAFATGLAHRVINALPPAIEGDVLDDKPKDLPVPPPPSNPTFREPKVTAIDPKFEPLDTGTEDVIHTATVVDRDPPGPPIPPPPAPINRVLGNAGKGFPNSADYYPPTAIRMGETGKVLVQVCVNSKGYLTGTPTLAKSSGSARLDEGALKLARAGSGHYRPTTENGQPVDTCFPVAIAFNIKD
jgi:periplasmic protein TonB